VKNNNRKIMAYIKTKGPQDVLRGMLIFSTWGSRNYGKRKSDNMKRNFIKYVR
jgi:hypothetical protein